MAGPLDWNRNVVALVTVESLTVDNLMEFEPDGQVKPGVASSVEQPNPTTYVYHLKSIKFSDGNPMTAADVVFSLERNIHGREAWAKAYWEDVASITAPNSKTVVVKLKQPNAIFQRVVAFTGEVIEKSAAEKVNEKELGTPGHLLIGTGPWKLDNYKPEVSAQLSPNPYWTGAARPAQKITIDLFKTEASMALALRSGEIDGAFNYQSPKDFANISGVRQLTSPGATVTLVSANTKSPPLNDVHVRRAVAYASDAKGMIGAIYPHGEAIEDASIIPPSFFGGMGTPSEVNAVQSGLPKYEFDLEKARQELAKSAYPHGFSTEIAVEQVESAAVSAAEILSADLAKIGITAKVHELPSSEAAAVLGSGKSKLEVLTIYGFYPDPEGIMSSILAPSQINPPGSGINIANYRNAEVDRLMPESLETLNSAKRLQMIGRLLGIVASEAPYWPLYTHASFWALSEKYVMPQLSWWTAEWGTWALGVKLAS
jgi:peptide/nickel transport system substrate-binding protein